MLTYTVGFTTGDTTTGPPPGSEMHQDIRPGETWATHLPGSDTINGLWDLNPGDPMIGDTTGDIQCDNTCLRDTTGHHPAGNSAVGHTCRN